MFRARGFFSPLIFLTALLCASPSLISAKRTRRPQKTLRAAAPRFSPGQALRATLKNGLRVVIVYDPLSPAVTTVVNYLAGSDEAPAGFPGMAHATEHMMFRGSPGLSADQLAEIGAGLGGDFNADTQEALTQYFFTTPSTFLETALGVEALRMKALSSTDSSWEKERGAIEQEVSRDLSDPEYILYAKILKSLFKGTPYEHDALGTRPSFDKTTALDLKKFHDSWYAPNNAVLVIAGDVDPHKTLMTVQKIFEKIPAKTLPRRPIFSFSPVEESLTLSDTDSPYGLIAFAFRFPGSNNPDYAAFQILADALSSERGKLYDLQVQGQALFANFDYQSFAKAGIGFVFAGFPKGANAQKLLKKTRSVLKKEIASGIDPDLVEASKRHEIASAEFEKNSVSGLAMEWSEAVAGKGRSEPDQDISAMKKVTVEDVDRVARKYIDFGHVVSAILTPRPSGKPVARNGFGGQESFASSKVKETRLPLWARQATESLRISKQTLKPEVSILPNGIELIVAHESVSPTVSVYGHIRSNPKMEESAGQEGASRVLGQLFSYGSVSLNRLAFQKALDDIAAEEGAGTDFSLKVLAGQFEKGVKLLADNELSPALPNRDFKIIRHETEENLVGEIQSPDYLTARALKKALYLKTDSALRKATPQTVKSLDLSQIRDYYARVFRPDMTTIVVIGQVTPQQARDVIGRYFGNWKAAGPKPNVDFSTAPPNSFSKAQVPDLSRLQDKVILAQNLGLSRLSSDYYALHLGNEVLGGAFYASRLSRDLRKKNGLVYGVSSSLNLGRVRGTYQVEYGCDPDKVSTARAIILSDVEAMREKDASPHEIKQAKVLLFRGISLERASVDGIAGLWLYLRDFGLSLDEPIHAEGVYLKLGASDVRKAFARWMRPRDMAEIIEGPSPR